MIKAISIILFFLLIGCIQEATITEKLTYDTELREYYTLFIYTIGTNVGETKVYLSDPAYASKRDVIYLWEKL